LVTAAVVEVRPEVRELLADIEVLDQLAAELGEDDARQVEVLLALETALDGLELADVPGTAGTARAALAAALGRPAYDGAHRVSAVGTDVYVASLAEEGQLPVASHVPERRPGDDSP